MNKYILSYFIKLANNPGLDQRLESKSFKKEVFKGYFLGKIQTNEQPSPEEVLRFEKTFEELKGAILKIVPENLTVSQKAQCVEWLKSLASQLCDFIISESRHTDCTIKKDLERYFLYHTYIETSKKDLPRIKSNTELHSVVNSAEKEYQVRDQSNTKKYVEFTEYLLDKDPDWEILIPHSHGASVYHGRDTHWCSSSSNPEKYNSYYKPEDPLIIFINKHNRSEKYKFHYGKQEFRDINNKEIENMDLFYKLHSLLLSIPDIEKRFSNINNRKLSRDKDNNILEHVKEQIPGGTLEYHRLNGKPHRDGGPAATYPDGTQKWYQNGKLHRDDGPAVIHLTGKDTTIEDWYHHGILFKTVTKHPISTKEVWYKNNKMHRDDGPAEIYTTRSSTIKKWYQNGKLHRDDGPAVDHSNGDQEWYQHGQLHRDGGPAVIEDNVQKWYQHGKVHRDDGPAVIYNDGGEFWFLNGKSYFPDTE